MLKEDILYELETHRDMPISGQELADRFSVSRNAVWKVINSLKEEGYRISSTRNKGYMLEGTSDVLSKAGILAELQGTAPDLEIRILDEVDSTNNEAKRMLASGFSGKALIVAETQTMGRGRRGKSFYSPAGAGLYFSLILPAGDMTDKISMLTIVTACAVLRALKKKTDAPVQLKWVNDLFIGEKKLGGILSEATTDLESGRTEAVVIGIGINLRKTAFPDELKEVAVALNSQIPRNVLIAELVRELLSADWARPEKELDFYRENSLVLSRKIWYEREEVLALEIDDTGALVVQHGDGREETIRGGSIFLKKK
ncbi:MAG: biotin--[acetyl-CoA-carboxylase] ligase [Lachnospiraceae bacterium]|nr:biotin--[acetyl-CoA-carboxylase] ligase [Lachnospiraceae bacterium]